MMYYLNVLCINTLILIIDLVVFSHKPGTDKHCMCLLTHLNDTNSMYTERSPAIMDRNVWIETMNDKIHLKQFITVTRPKHVSGGEQTGPGVCSRFLLTRSNKIICNEDDCTKQFQASSQFFLLPLVLKQYMLWFDAFILGSY